MRQDYRRLGHENAGLGHIIPACMHTHYQCYGLHPISDGTTGRNSNSLEACHQCILGPDGHGKTADVVVLSTAVHLMEARGGGAGAAPGTDKMEVAANVVKDIENIQKVTKNIVWASGPKTRKLLVPEKVKGMIDFGGLDYVFDHTCGNLNAMATAGALSSVLEPRGVNII